MGKKIRGQLPRRYDNDRSPSAEEYRLEQACILGAARCGKYADVGDLRCFGADRRRIADTLDPFGRPNATATERYGRNLQPGRRIPSIERRSRAGGVRLRLALGQADDLG